METIYELHSVNCVSKECDSDCLTKQDVIKWVFRLDDKLDELKRLHQERRESFSRKTYCSEDGQSWPCETITIVGSDHVK